MNITTKFDRSLDRAWIALIVLSMVAFTARAASTAGATVPQSLVDAAEYGENVYDYAKAKEWKRADATLKSLLQAAEKMHIEVADQNTAKSHIDDANAALRKDIAAKDQQAAMRDANQITLDVANITAAYSPTVPVAVTKLDYYGRELEIWAQAGDIGKLKATVAAMRREWNALRPSVQSRRATEASRFEALVSQVEAATAPAEYARLATSLLDEVDNLEKVY
jgi:hypothetical protein